MYVWHTRAHVCAYNQSYRPKFGKIYLVTGSKMCQIPCCWHNFQGINQNKHTDLHTLSWHQVLKKLWSVLWKQMSMWVSIMLHGLAKIPGLNDVNEQYYLSQAPFGSLFCEHFLLLLFVELTKLKVGTCGLIYSSFLFLVILAKLCWYSDTTSVDKRYFQWLWVRNLQIRIGIWIIH